MSDYLKTVISSDSEKSLSCVAQDFYVYYDGFQTLS